MTVLRELLTDKIYSYAEADSVITRASNIRKQYHTRIDVIKTAVIWFNLSVSSDVTVLAVNFEQKLIRAFVIHCIIYQQKIDH